MASKLQIVGILIVLLRHETITPISSSLLNCLQPDKLSLALLFSLEDVGWDQLDKLLIEDLQYLPAEHLKLRLLPWQVVVQDLRKCLPYDFKVLKREVRALKWLPGSHGQRSLGLLPIFTLLGRRRFGLLPEKGHLESKCIHDIEIPEDDHSSRALLTLFDAEAAVLKSEKASTLMATQQRDHSHLRILYSALMLIVLVGTRVKEGVLFP